MYEFKDKKIKINDFVVCGWMVEELKVLYMYVDCVLFKIKIWMDGWLVLVRDFWC